MKYTLESYQGNVWRPSIKCRQFDDVERAVLALQKKANLTCVAWDLRVVDEDAKTYATYCVDNDMRLPGCRWTTTQRDAYELWVAAGRPEGDGVEFWHKAEEQLPDSIGVTVLCE